MSVRCETCNGTGQRALRDVERETLAALSATQWRGSAEIGAGLPGKVKATALANRLARLVEVGLVEVRRHEDPSDGKRQWRRR